MKNLFEFLVEIRFPMHRWAVFGVLGFAAAFFEGFGLAMFLPLLEFIEKGQDLTILAQDNRYWKILIAIFDKVDLPVTLVSLMSIIFFLILCRVMFIYLRKIYTAWLAQEILHATRTRLFSSCLKAAYNYLDSLNTGKLVNLATIEAARAGGHLQSFFELTANSLVLVGYFLVLLWLSAPMTGLAVIILFAAALVVSFFIRHTRRLSKQTTDSNQKFSFHLIERLTAFRLIKLTSTEERESERLKEDSEKVRDYNYWLAKLNARVDLLLEPIVVVGGIIILYLSVGVFKMTLAQVGLFMLVLLRLLPLSKEVLRSRQTFLANAGGLEAVIAGFRNIQASREMKGDGRSFAGIAKCIRFENVTFTYPAQNQPALKNIDLFIPAGKMTALVGPSGGGKSTLADILVGLRLPEAGTVFFDDRPLSTFDLRSLRRGMAFVSQDAFVFNDTVRNNISFAKPDATDDEIRDAMDQALVSEFVNRLPQGAESMLGERGAKLSGGQKQRLSLARALLQKAPILVLDEATSALDSEREVDIQAAIEKVRQEEEVTILVIAHRLSTIRNADQIVVLNDGQVVETGDHASLMVNEAWYAGVAGIQSQ